MIPIAFEKAKLPNPMVYGTTLDVWGTDILDPTRGKCCQYKTRSNAGPVADGLLQRITDGRNMVYCPVVDFQVAKGGSSSVKILGYVRLESLAVNMVLEKGNDHVKITGKFTNFIEKQSSLNQQTEYYGVKSINLVK